MSRQRDASPESETSSTGGGLSKISKSGELSDMQKKMKILKDALIKERQEKENVQKTKKDAEKELERLQSQIQEKEGSIKKHEEEISSLQVKLQAERKKADTPQAPAPKPQTITPAQQESGWADKVSITGLTGMFGFKKGGNVAEEYQKLTGDYNYAKKQLEVMKEKLSKAEGSIEQVKKDARQQAEENQKKLQEVEKDLETRIQAYRELNRKYEDTNGSIAGLRRDKERLEQDINRIKKENESLLKETEDFEREQVEKQKLIEELSEECQTTEAELAKHVGNLGTITSQLEEMQMRLQILDVKKAGKVMDTPAQIVMRKNVKGEYVVEIEGAGERLILFPQVIQSFGPLPDTEDKFYLDFRVKEERGYLGGSGSQSARETIQRDVYQTEDRKKVLKYFKIFLKLAEGNQANSKNTERGALHDKNLLTQMVSFFNN